MSINIKTYGSFVKLPVNHLAGHTVISIDVLRSSSCIVWGLVNGASKIIPVDDLGSAVSIASRMGDCVLAGERGAVLIPGFDIGNSPAEYTEARVGGKAVVISTTNGTGAICKSESASNVLIGSMLNCTADVYKRQVLLHYLMGKTHQHPVNILLCHEPRFEFHVLHSFIPRTDFSQQKSLVFTLRQGLIKLSAYTIRFIWNFFPSQPCQRLCTELKSLTVRVIITQDARKSKLKYRQDKIFLTALLSYRPVVL